MTSPSTRPADSSLALGLAMACFSFVASMATAAPTATDLDRRALIEHVRADQYAFAPDADGYRARNRLHRLAIDVSDGTLRLGPTGKQSWSSELRLVRYGHKGAMRTAAPIATRAAGSQLEIEHSGLVEWYLNDLRGLEQGFTVSEAPTVGADGAPTEGRSGSAAGPLVLEMDLCGSLDANQDGSSVRLTDRATAVAFRYEGLVAWDATGRTLPAAMQLANGRLALEVDTTDASYPITVDPTFVNEDVRVTASDADVGDGFGYAVAIDGEVAVVGARFNNDVGSGSGSAYVFVRSGPSSWSEDAKLTASDAASSDQFGISVAISGFTVLVGAMQADAPASNSGAAYVYVRSGPGSWPEEAKLTASDGAGTDYFGWAVAIDGDTAAIGAYLDDDVASASGSAYVFERSGIVWSEEAKLNASDAAADDNFGKAVAISGDTVVVGALQDDDVASGSGSAYVFTRTGVLWSEEQKLTASDAAGGDQFGVSVAVDGDTALIGAYLDDDVASASGSAYVFTRFAMVWSEEAKLTASDAADTDLFGQSVSLSGDVAVVGSNGDDDAGGQSGSAYVFTRSGVTWSENVKLVASDAGADDRFGTGVAVSGTTALIGAYQDDDDGADAGSAYLFHDAGVPLIFGTELLVDFGSLGTWMLEDDIAWSRVHTQSTNTMVAGDLDGSGIDDIVIGLTGGGKNLGLWVLYDNTVWVRLHGRNPLQTVIGDLDGNGDDDLIADFGPGIGIWAWMNDTSWTGIHSLLAGLMLTAQLDGVGGDELVLSFAGAGTWIWANHTSWSRLHGLEAGIGAAGNFDGVADDDLALTLLGTSGLWVYSNNTSWSKVEFLDPFLLATGDLDGSGMDELIVDFGWDYGLYAYYDFATWVFLHPRSPLTMVTADLDGSGADELIVDLGPGVTFWALYDDLLWQRLHAQSPNRLATGEIVGQ